MYLQSSSDLTSLIFTKREKLNIYAEMLYCFVAFIILVHAQTHLIKMQDFSLHS